MKAVGRSPMLPVIAKPSAARSSALQLAGLVLGERQLGVVPDLVGHRDEAALPLLQPFPDFRLGRIRFRRHRAVLPASVRVPHRGCTFPENSDPGKLPSVVQKGSATPRPPPPSFRACEESLREAHRPQAESGLAVSTAACGVECFARGCFAPLNMTKGMARDGLPLLAPRPQASVQYTPVYDRSVP